jgi:hypothetical protein
MKPRHGDCSVLPVAEREAMTTRIERAPGGLFLFAVVALAACGDSGPTSLTGSSDLPPRETSAHDFGAGQTGVAHTSALEEALEDFDCTSVETVRVRFSSPGYVEDDKVGLYVYFDGLAPGRKRLRIWWDYENDSVHFRDFQFPGEETEIEEVYEHRYLNLRGSTEMLVRVELIRDGLTGNCPRNRRVTVAPPPVGAPGAPPPAAPTTQTANVGPGIGNVDSYDFNYSDGVKFTVLTPLTIDSVWVDPGAAGTLGITLWDSSGSTVLNSTSVSVNPGPRQVAVGFAVPPGDYYLTLDGTTLGFAGAGATTTWGAASYPYGIPGVISLTDSAFGFGAIFGWYFFLYDWQVTW